MNAKEACRLSAEFRCGLAMGAIMLAARAGLNTVTVKLEDIGVSPNQAVSALQNLGYGVEELVTEKSLRINW